MTKLVRVEGDPPEPIEDFPNERKIRVAVRASLAAIVKPLTVMLPVDKSFDVVGQELLVLREWFEAEVAKQKEEKNGDPV